MPTQQRRLIQFHPPSDANLDANDLLLRRIDYNARLGRLSAMTLDLYSTRDLENDDDTTFDDLIGKPVQVRMDLEDGAGGYPNVGADQGGDGRGSGVRWYHGIIIKFSKIASDTSNYHRYQAMVVPELWLLTQNRNCRIFHDKTALEIIKVVLAEHDIVQEDAVAAANHLTREYCVQYNESDFDFITRLMEDEGIYYFFEFTDTAATMVLCDGPEDHEAYPGYEYVFDGGLPTDNIFRKTVTDRRVEKSYHAGEYIVTDYDYETQSSRNPFAVSTSTGAQHQVFEYPANFHRPGAIADQATEYADLRRLEQEARQTIVSGASPSTGINVGFEIKFSDATDAAAYLVTKTRLVVDSNDFESDDAGSGRDYDTTVKGTFQAIAASTRFLMKRVTPKPIVPGVQTAIVIGDPGTKGDPPTTDDLGRVRVRFHWDGFGREDGSATYQSCWVRVSQNWAGKNWGALTLPHKGQEVIVDFIEGNPDRPLIVGRVYNKATMPYLNPQENVNRFVMRDFGENRMTMHSEAGKEVIEFYSPTENSAITIGHKVASSSGHGDGVDIEPTRAQSGTADTDVSGVKIITDAHLACVTTQDIIFDCDRSFEGRCKERWYQKVEGVNHAATGSRSTPNAVQMDIEKGDAVLNVKDGSLQIDVGGSKGKFDMDVNKSFDLDVDANYTEDIKGDFSSTVHGWGDRLNHSNATSATLGSTNDLFIGQKGSLHLGLDFSAFIGGKVSFTLAAELALNIGLKAEANIGGSISLDVAARHEWVFGPHTDNKPSVDVKTASLVLDTVATCIKKSGSDIDQAGMSISAASLTMLL